MKLITLSALVTSIALATTAQAAVVKKPVVKTPTSKAVKTTTKKAVKVAPKVKASSNSQGEINMDIPADTKINETRSVNGQAVSMTAPVPAVMVAPVAVVPVTDVASVDVQPAQ